jgi:hypothetical protein
MTQPTAFAPPPDLAVPATLQNWFLGITIVLAAGVLAASAGVAMRRRSVAPVLMVLGGLAAIVMEPVVTYLGHAVHPEQGQIMMFKAVDRAIPWHIGLGYMGGFGLFYLALYGKYLDRTLTAATVWKTTLVTAACYFIGEAIPVSYGLWAYYDYQPLWLWKGTAPITWNVLNATCMLTSATLMLATLRHLKGIAQLLLVPLAAAGAYMGHLGAGFPMYIAINSTLPTWAMELSGVASVALALLIVWLCTIVLVRERAAVTAGSRSPGPARGTRSFPQSV